MNTGVLILFVNAIVTTLISSAVVIWILKKEYLPTIKKLEADMRSKEGD
ncbi:hypothetical protein MHB50_05390 [Siminovitchia sp. FSL H7-0308]|uniref:Uncharacterized protein n=1 Tax=Siminovitchia thermophila TaxID=1245522 RepID=A0ABS2R2E1_9BACI|nr:hypothetical protein [Siminovitchia thermophila]MBM7713555.1 hypothetical protein [Siminovitchia thermophila]